MDLSIHIHGLPQAHESFACSSVVAQSLRREGGTILGASAAVVIAGDDLDVGRRFLRPHRAAAPSLGVESPLAAVAISPVITDVTTGDKLHVVPRAER